MLLLRASAKLEFGALIASQCACRRVHRVINHDLCNCADASVVNRVGSCGSHASEPSAESEQGPARQNECRQDMRKMSKRRLCRLVIRLELFRQMA